jgi:hypothetical protein
MVSLLLQTLASLLQLLPLMLLLLQLLGIGNVIAAVGVFWVPFLASHEMMAPPVLGSCCCQHSLMFSLVLLSILLLLFFLLLLASLDLARIAVVSAVPAAVSGSNVSGVHSIGLRLSDLLFCYCHPTFDYQTKKTNYWIIDYRNQYKFIGVPKSECCRSYYKFP